MFLNRTALILLSGLASPLLLQAQAPSLEALAPAKADEAVRFTFKAPPGVTWATVFYRARGEEEFRSLMLQGDASGLGASLPATEIGGRSIEYYLAFKGGEGIRYLPEEAPSAMKTLELGPGSGPSPQGSGIRQKLPFHVDGSLEQVAYRSQKVEGERSFMDSGQIGVGYELEAGEHHLSLNARVAYQGQPTDGQPRWALSELRGSYSFREHRAQVGDMAFQESEFSIGGMGRRGMDYLYDDQTLYAHVFAVGTEQLSGFRGLAWPAESTRLFGGALGYTWMGGQLKSKVVVLSGRDDPAQGVNLGVSSSLTRREGSIGALVLEADLKEHRLSLNGEYARSSYDKDLSDTLGKVQDQAWRLGGAWTERAYCGRLSYRQIGRDFGSLGYPVMDGDRRGADGGFSLNLSPTWSLNANATLEVNNPNADPLETRARNEAQSLDAQWTPTSGVTLKAGCSRGSQEAGGLGGADSALIPFANSRRTGYLAGVDWAVGANGALAFSVQFDRLESTGSGTSTTGRSTTLLLGGSLLVPDTLRLAPTLSYAKSVEDGTGQDSRVFSAFLNADVTVVPKWVSLALNGGYNRSEALGLAPVVSTSGDAALQYYLTPYLERSHHLGQAILALRCRYTRVQTLPEADRRASLTLNFSF